MTLAEVSRSSDVLAVFDKFDGITKGMLAITDDDVTALSSYLDAAITSQTLSIRKTGINRRRIERIFGYPEETLDSEPFAPLLAAWERWIDYCGYTPNTQAITAEDNERILNPVVPRSPFLQHSRSLGDDSVAKTLWRTMKQDYDDGTLVLNKYGRIARMHYANLLGITKSNLTRHRATFEYFEEKFGELKSTVVAMLPKLRAWFIDEISKGTLKIIDGKVVVSDIVAQAGVSHSTIYNTTAAKDLISWMNDEVARLGYVPRSDTDPALQLSQALPHVELNVDGLTINRNELWRRGVLKRGDLRRPSVKEVIRAFELKLRTAANDDPLKTVIDERAWDFSNLIEQGWPREIAVLARDLFHSGFGGVVGRELYSFRDAVGVIMGHLASQTTEAARVSFSSICERRDISTGVWRSLIGEVQTDLRAKFSNAHQPNKARFINVIIDVYADGGLFPSNSYKVSPSSSKTRRGRASLAELVAPPVPTAGMANSHTEAEPSIPETSEYVSFARWVLMQRETGDGDSIEDEKFLEVLEQEFVREGSLLASNPIDAIVHIITRRLGLILGAAYAMFASWRDHFERGRSFVERGVSVPLTSNLFSANRKSREYRAALDDFFPVLTDAPQATANLLRLMMDHYGGFLPNSHHDKLFINRMGPLGYGSREFQAFLVPDNDAVGAAIVMYMVESGANNAVSRTLWENAVEDADELGYRKITGEKARAGGRPIYTNLHRSSKALEAIGWLSANSTLLRDNASPGEAELMFLISTQKGRIAHPEAHWLLVFFKRLIDTIPELRDLGVTPAMIRTSVILMDAMTTQGDLRMGIARAQHDPASTSVYQIRGVTRYIYDRRYAQFQLDADRLIRDVAEKRLAPGMKPTGTGGVCLIGGCADMKCWDSCPKFALIADPPFLADLQIWGDALKEYRAEWERDRPERWNAQWLNHLILAEELTKRFRGSELSQSLRGKWKRGQAIAAERKARPDFVAPRIH